MQRFSEFVLRHKLLVTLIWLALSAAGVVAITRMEGRLSEGFSQPGQAAFETNQAIARTYGSEAGNEPLIPVITLPEGRTVDSPGTREVLGKAFASVAETTGARVVSYADTGDPRFVGRDGRTTFALVFTPDVAEEFRGADQSGPVAAALGSALPDGTAVQVTGMDPLEESGDGGGGGGGISLLAETLIGGVGALAVLAFVFGSFLALVPLLIAAVSILACFLSIYGLAGVTPVSDIVQYIVAMLGLGVAIDYSLLLVTRWREEQSSGHRGDEAVRRAMATAGRAVIFSGVTVAIGLFAMVLLPVPFLRSVGYGGLLIPVVSMLAVITLLPVILATMGRRLDWPRLRKDSSASPGWTAWARRVVRYRWPAAVASCAVLLALAGTALGLRLGEADSGSLAKSGPAYEALTTLKSQGVSSGVLTPIDVLVSGDPAPVAARLAAVPGVRTAAAPDSPAWRKEGTALITVVPAAEGSSREGQETVERVRAAVPESARVGGPTAENMDFVQAVYGSFPLMLLLISVVTFLLLARGFRSLLLPLKAILLNLLSLAAVIGAMVLVWQYGYGSKLIWNIEPTGAIVDFVPVMVFAFLYGLSMDYEVFILARMREEYDRTGSTHSAIVEGIGRTGRLVTSAALILFLAFASLAAAPAVELKIFATGLGLGVLLDATVIRALLVPALVSLMGRWNWWLPVWAARLLRVPPSAAESSRPDPVPVTVP
ncbi:MMPL family transporter [Planomonospora venezuelensis]|uniref:RND superfamily putative drug exporter n=1 Tax=Planomonospora venezuelensis TaxID=1999 RepID=A0A841D1N3_PLAVE|nr:MMPL family transporter [Planomonospora venezuelensis]MBB5962414.1 RND superfamily putative drug exporter [Planomonospora venezuelensis]GIN00796.1 membrane protein [Planomonospora venezuelensis]